jgi:hypothetical protein
MDTQPPLPKSLAPTLWGKTIIGISLMLALILVLIVSVAGFLIGTKTGQDWVQNLVSRELTQRLGSEVIVEGFDLGWNRLTLGSIAVVGCPRDTLLQLKKVDLTWTEISFLQREFQLNALTVDLAMIEVHPITPFDSSNSKNAAERQGSNWDCLWQRIPKSSNEGSRGLALTLRKALIKQINWRITGYPAINAFAPTKTMGLSVTHVKQNAKGWRLNFAMDQFTAHNPQPFHASGSIAGRPDGRIEGKTLHVKHPEARLVIPRLVVDSSLSFMAQNARLLLAEGHLNRWIPATGQWPNLSMHCPSVVWKQGHLEWLDLNTELGRGLRLETTGHWRLTSLNPPHATGSAHDDTTLALAWSLHTHSSWDQIWTKVQQNLRSGLMPRLPLWNIQKIPSYLPVADQWISQGKAHQSGSGFLAETQIRCGPSQLQIIAQRTAPQSPWTGTFDLHGYQLPGTIGLGNTHAQWSYSDPQKLLIQLKSEEVVWQKEKFRNLEAKATWNNNSLAGELDLQDSLHALQSDWNALLSNGKLVSIAGRGHLDFQFPSLPELCGPLRALGEFSFRDSGQTTQVDLADGALLCDFRTLPVQRARFKLDRQTPGHILEIAFNEDSLHAIGLRDNRYFTQALKQVKDFLIGDTTGSGNEIPFRAFFKINNLEDYTPFWTQAPPMQGSNLKGNLQWSLPASGSGLFWNRSIRLDIGSAEWQGWAARKISIRTEYLGPTMLVQGQLDSLSLNQKALFQKINYQQIRDRDKSTIRLSGADSTGLPASLFQGTLKNSENQWVLGIDSLRARVANQLWSSVGHGKIRRYGDVWDLDSITLAHDSSKLHLDGLLSEKRGNKIKLDILNLGLEQVTALLGQRNRLLRGVINGQITGDGILDQPNFTGDLRIPGLELDSMVLGDLFVQSSFVPQTNRLELNAHLDNESGRPASVNGWLQTDESSVPCDLTVQLKGAPLQLLELVLLPNLDSIRGNANADIRLTGSLKEPQMKGMLTLNEGRLRIPYLKNNYRITGSIRIEPDQFVFANNDALDQDRGRAKISGWVKHRNFRNWTYRFQMDSAKNLLVLNEPRLLREDYYHGLGRINGQGFITGNEQSTRIQISAEAVKGSRLIIPLDELSEENAYEFIRFKEITLSGAMASNEDNDKAVSLRGLELNLNLVLTPESEVSLLIDRRFGDQIKGTGNGNLNLTLSQEGNIALTGNYIFQQGNYTFNLVNLVNKNFEIKSGGRIDWNGDPYAGNMQIEAVYKQRASVRNLLGSNLSGQTDSRNILPVETYLNLSGPILQPGVKFRLNLPTINIDNPNDILVQQITRINNNEQELNNQVLGLLVSGQFIPSENLNSTNLGLSTGATAFNSVTEMLTTRLSNLLNNSLGGGFNIGINYRGDLGTGILNSGNGNNNSLADSNRRDLNVALNTSLFNNRLIIDGNLAMGNSLQVNSRNMAGEINLEYLINPSGTIRAKAFNRPDDRILFNQNQNLNYRQGIGLSYNRNFNRWSELIRKNPRP